MTIDVPTLYIVILTNCIALAVVWLFVIQAHPNLTAARLWLASSLCAAIGAAGLLVRVFGEPLIAILLGNGLLILSSGLSWLGTRQFLGERLPWGRCIALTLMALAGLALFSIWHNDIAARIAIFSAGQSIFLVFAMGDLLSSREGRRTPGMKLAAFSMATVALSGTLRSALGLAGVGGDLSFISYNAVQASFLLATLFSGMVWNFGFLLMTIDRLRGEMIELAVIDDLTGIANRRRFIERLDEECSRSARTGQPFVLLAIDLDGFKGVNDVHGHQAGDACLRAFTRSAQALLRPHDLLARTGGDEFCAILPATSLEEAESVARSLVEASRAPGTGGAYPITVSVGLAEWSKRIGRDSDLLLALADEVLYEAKRGGRDRFVSARRDRLFKLLDARSTKANATGF
jgi:diguanylate cyclase (GGDEF)-like protein